MHPEKEHLELLKAPLENIRIGSFDQQTASNNENRQTGSTEEIGKSTTKYRGIFDFEDDYDMEFETETAKFAKDP